MRAISLWQPWASAIALGLKKIETRGRSTAVRGPIAIHAAKCWTKEQREFAEGTHANLLLPAELPFGCIVAVVDLVGVRFTSDIVDRIDSTERMFGNYDDGRYGWILENVRPLPKPIPFKGKQGFFFVPDELLA